MSLIKHSIRIPSININKGFLEDLGKILSEFKLDSKKHSYCSSLVTINSPDESLELKSLSELLSTTYIPKNITNITIRINHFIYLSKKDMDLLLDFDNRYAWQKGLELSSEDEGNLLRVEKTLNNLFDKYKTRYNSLYSFLNLNIGFSLLIHVLLSLILIFLPPFLLIKFNLIKVALNDISIRLFAILFFVIFMILWLSMGNILDYMLPRYNLSLSHKRSLRTIIIVILGYIIFTLILPTLAGNLI